MDQMLWMAVWSASQSMNDGGERAGDTTLQCGVWASDQGWPWAQRCSGCLHPHYADQCCSGQPASADIYCSHQTSDYKETWDQDQISVNSWEPMGRRQQSGRAMPAVSSCCQCCLPLPGIASQSPVVRAGTPKVAPILLIFCSGCKYWTFCFVCGFAQQTKMWRGKNWFAEIGLSALTSRGRHGATTRREEARAASAKHRLVLRRTGKKQERDDNNNISVLLSKCGHTPAPVNW